MPPRLEQEGNVFRFACDCGARGAATVTYEEALAIASKHRCIVKRAPKKCSGRGNRPVECTCLLSLPGVA